MFTTNVSTISSNPNLKHIKNRNPYVNGAIFAFVFVHYSPPTQCVFTHYTYTWKQEQGKPGQQDTPWASSTHKRKVNVEGNNTIRSSSSVRAAQPSSSAPSSSVVPLRKSPLSDLFFFSFPVELLNQTLLCMLPMRKKKDLELDSV